MRAPWFKFFAEQWLADRRIRFLTPEQRGYLIQLQAEAWGSQPRGTIPSDPEHLWRLAGAESRESFEKNSAAVLALFRHEGDVLCVPELQEQAEKLERDGEARSRAGKASASKRKQHPSNTCSTSEPTRVEHVKYRKEVEVEEELEKKRTTDLRAAHAKPSQSVSKIDRWTEQNSFAYRQFCKELTECSQAGVEMSDENYRAMVLRIARRAGVPDHIALELEHLPPPLSA
jgi:uncharacterized protein YdaU (DUF1376 family)